MKQQQLKHFILQWKHTRQLDFVQGASWREAFDGNFNPKGMANVARYEEVKACHLSGKIKEGVFPFTVYYTESASGVMIRMIKGPVNDEFKKLLITRTCQPNPHKMIKHIYKVFNELYNGEVVE